jgi:hypothetical protein
MEAIKLAEFAIIFVIVLFAGVMIYGSIKLSGK